VAQERLTPISRTTSREIAREQNDRSGATLTVTTAMTAAAQNGGIRASAGPDLVHHSA